MNTDNEQLVDIVADVAMIEGFNKADALLIATAMCKMRDRVLKEYSLPGLITSSTSQAEANEKRANDMGDPEKIILEIKNALGGGYTNEDLLNTLKNYT